MRGNPQAPRGGASGRCPELGLQRVNWVRIEVDRDGTRCVVAGLAHRRPVLRQVPLRTVTALLAAGVPGVVRTAADAEGAGPASTSGRRSLAGDRG